MLGPATEAEPAVEGVQVQVTRRVSDVTSPFAATGPTAPHSESVGGSRPHVAEGPLSPVRSSFVRTSGSLGNVSTTWSSPSSWWLGTGWAASSRPGRPPTLLLPRRFDCWQPAVFRSPGARGRIRSRVPHWRRIPSAIGCALHAPDRKSGARCSVEINSALRMKLPPRVTRIHISHRCNFRH